MEKNKAQADRKKEIRREALKRRDCQTKEQRREADGTIFEKLTALPCYREADVILTYVSFRSEVDTFPLIRHALAARKAVFTPKVLGRDMEFFRILSIDDLQKGYQGIREPTGHLSYDDYISQFNMLQTLICLPGAAFDRNRHRIGYGGGFYDRYLSKIKESRTGTVKTAALAFDCQIFEEIPWETYDVCPACIVTEREIIL